MNQSQVRIDVELGLDQAQKQAQSLFDILNKSVKPDSTAFKSINEQINGAIRLANKLHGSLDTAFKTSSSSNKFLNEMEKLFDSLSSITNQFNYLKGKDLIQFDSSDQLKQLRKDLADTEAEIKRLESHKIGNIFDGDTKGFDAVRSFIAGFSKDLSKVSFEEFNTAMTKAMDKATNDLNTAKKAVEEFQNATNSVKMGNIASVIQDLNSAVNKASGGISKTLTSVSATDVKQKIKDLYAAQGLSTQISAKSKDVTEKIGVGSSFDKTIEEQTANISKALDKQKDVIDAKRVELENAKAKIDEVLNKKTYTTEAGAKLTSVEEKAAYIKDNILKQFNITPEDFTKGQAGGLSGWVQGIQTQLESQIKDMNIDTVREKMVEQLKSIFEGQEFNAVADSANGGLAKIKQVVESFFTEKGIDISTKDNPIKKVIDSLKGGYDLNTFSTDLVNAFKSMSDGYDSALSGLNGKVQEAEQALNHLKEVEETFKGQTSGSDAALNAKKQAAEGYRQAIASLIAEMLKLLNAEAGKTGGDEAANKYARATQAVREFTNSLSSLEGKQKALSNVQSAVTRWMGFYQVLNLTKKAINEMKQHIQELDTVMTKIAVVTNFSQDDLWKQISQYSEIARQYGVAIKGVYEVSQIYYQQGLNKGDVMGLTTETLKMARIAGLDYATAADYMTTAIRGFKMEMSEASHVTDVFSALAASTASSTEELAVAISKTAASAASVGASFEATSAMMATMIATTRESATNIGTALKSIIARYGELKQNMSGTDAEGEEYSLNKVDKALQSVGISIHNAKGEFRDFDDVILELGEAWNTIDKNAQRYIATVMAGNRQQSRFLALVSNVEEYKRALEIANDSGGSGELQTLKTLDSIDAKIERMKVTIQEFYTSSGLQDLYKGILDTITNVISAANSLPKLFDTIPVQALAIGANLIRIIKNVLLLLINTVRATLNQAKGEASTAMKGIIAAISSHFPKIKESLKTTVQSGIAEGGKAGAAQMSASVQGALSGGFKGLLKAGASTILTYAGGILGAIGGTLSLAGLNDYGKSTRPDDDRAAGGKTVGGAVLGILGDAATGAATGAMLGAGTGPGAAITAVVGGLVGAVKGVITNLATFKSGLDMMNVSLAREIELSSKKVESTKTKATTSQNETKSLITAVTKLQQLEDAAYNSVEAMNEYHEYMNQLAESYPYLVSEMDNSGNKIIEVSNLENILAQSRLNTARATIAAAEAELESSNLHKESYEKFSKTINQISTGTQDELDPSYYAQVISGSQATDKENPARRIADIPDIYERLVKYYDKAHPDKIEGLTVTKGKYRRNKSWEKLFYENQDAIIKLIHDQTRSEYDGGYKVEEDTRKKLQEALKTLKSEDDSINLSEVTQNSKIVEADDVLDETKISYNELIQAVHKAKKWASDQIGKESAVINQLTEAAFNTRVEEQVLEDASNTQKFTSKQGSTLTKHTSLFTALSKQLLKSDEAVTSEYNAQQINKLESWILENEEIANILETLDYNQISNSGAETIAKIIGLDLTKENDSWLAEILSKKYVEMTQATRDSFITALKEKIFAEENKKGNGSEKTNINFFTALTDEKDNSIIPALIPKLQSELIKYKALQDKGYTVFANSYLNNIKSLYGGISEITDTEVLDDVNNIIANTDLSDQDSLQDAIDAINKLSGVPESVTKSLQQLSDNINVNVVIQATQLADQAGELSTSVKKTFDNLGKGLSFDEALKAAQEIYDKLDKDEKAKINLKDLYKFNENLGQWTLTENAIQQELNNLTSDYNDEVSKLQTKAGLQKSLLESLKQAGSRAKPQDVLNSFLEKNNISAEEAEQYNILLESWQQGMTEGQTTTELYDELIQQIDQVTDNDLAVAESLLKNSAIAYLASFDWTSIASGTANEDTVKSQLIVLLRAAGVKEEELEQKVTSLYAAALEGNVAEMNKQLSGTGYQINAATSKNIIKTNVEKYTTAMSELLDGSTKEFSDTTKALAKALHYDLDTATPEQITELVNTINSKLDEYLASGQITLEEYNSAIATGANKANKKNGGGKQKAVLDAAKGGFTVSEFESIANDYGYQLNNFIDKNTGEITNEALKQVYSYDAKTDTYTLQAGKTVKDGLDAINTAFGLSIENATDDYILAYSESIDEAISENDKKDVNKLAASQLQTLSKASVGTTVNISGLSGDLKSKLGLTGDTYTVVSEAARDAIIAQIDQALIDAQDNPVLKATLQELKDQMDQTRNKASGYSKIMSSKVSKADAESYMTARGLDPKYTDLIMTQNLHFVWDAFAQEYVAIENTIADLRHRLELAIKDGASTEYINQETAKINSMEHDLKRGKKDNALLNILQNYMSATEDMFAAFNTAFGADFAENGIDINTILKKDETTGSYTVDVDALMAALQTIGFTMNDAADDQIKAIADSYISNIQKASSLVSSGTSSVSDMDTFVEEYNKIMKLQGEAQKTSGDLFGYNEILDTWTLKPEVLQEYVQAQANELKAQGKLNEQEINAWIQAQTTKALANNVNISDFLSAEDKGTTGDAYKKLAEQMREYWMSIGKSEAYAVSVINQEMEDLAAGGEAAVAVVERWAQRQGRTATSSEIEAAFNSAITELNTAVDQLAEVSKGSIVTGKLRAILSEAGGKWTVNSNGVVESVGNMADVYNAIYEEMKTTTGHTTAGLNAAYAKMLTAKEQGDIDAIAAMNDAFGMTYETLGELLAKSGTDLEAWLSQNTNLYESVGAGKIRITDFTAFAENQGWTPGSEEYTSAFKEYNDSLIEYNNKVKNQIKEEFQTLSEIDLSQGEQDINVTRLSQTEYFQNNIKQWIKDFGIGYKDGIITMTENTKLPEFIKALGEAGTAAGDFIESETQALIANLSTQKNANLQNAFRNIASNYQSISIDMIQALAKALDANFSDVAEKFEDLGDGTYKADITTIQALLNTYNDQLNDATKEAITGVITAYYDSILGSFNNATNLVNNGTTSVSEMQNFAKEFSTLMNEQYSIEQLFDYDAELNTFKLNNKMLHEYAEKQKAELEKMGMSGAAIDDYIASQTADLLQQNINVMDFFSAQDDKTKKKATKALEQAIKDWYESQGGAVADATVEFIIEQLDNGGEEAVHWLKQIKGENVSNEELAAAFNAKITPLRNMMTDFTKGIGDTVSGTSIAVMENAGYKLKRLDDGNAIITQVSTSIEGMVSAYLSIYEEMRDTAEHTTQDLNNAYAQVLTANSKKNVDAMDALSNGGKMTYQAFADLLTQYGKDYETVLGQGFAQDDGLGHIQITDFNAFANEMEWDISSPEYMEYYSNWVDSMIETRDNTVQKVFQEKTAEQISSLAEAKAGQSVNVAYLKKTLGDSLNEVVKTYGATLEGDILTLEDGADIPGLISAVAERAADAGALIPEQLAELADTISDMLSNITSIIGNGIKGSMSNTEAQQLNSWYREQQAQSGVREEEIQDLHFTRTTDGLKIANDEARKLYQTVRDIDAIQGEIVFDQLKDNLIEMDDHFKSVQDTEQHIKDITKELAKAQAEQVSTSKQRDQYNEAKKALQSGTQLDAFAQLKGNVAMDKRPNIDNGDGTYSTILGTTYGDTIGSEGNEIGVHMLMTPIPEWAESTEDILTSAELDSYVQALMDKNPVDIDALLELDAAGIEINGKEYKNLLIDVKDSSKVTAEAFEAEAFALHEWSDAWESAKVGREPPDNSERIDSLKEELALAQQIQAVRGTSEDDSFNFMSNKIPGGQNNPLNYMENWATAFEKMRATKKGGKGQKGMMEYTDFYNIITEMGNIAQLSGQAIPLGKKTVSNAEEAANLITEAAGALKVTADGKMKVDLSGIGVDFEMGADGLAKGVNAGIDTIADAQIDMLDSLIRLLEVVVAMEQLEDVDVNGDNHLNLGEIFVIDDPNADLSKLNKFTVKYQEAAKQILDMAGNDKELDTALKSVKINGTTMKAIFEDAKDGIKNIKMDAKTYQESINAFYEMAKSGDYDLDNIADSIQKIFAGKKLKNVSIDVGSKTFYLNGDYKYSIDWNNKDAINAAKKALKDSKFSSVLKGLDLNKDAGIKKAIDRLVKKRNEKGISIQDQAEIDYTLGIASGSVKINDKKATSGKYKDKFTGTYKGVTFFDADKDQVEAKIKKAMEYENQGYQFHVTSSGAVEGTVSISGAKITIRQGKDGKDEFVAQASDGSTDTFKTRQAAENWLVLKGDGTEGRHTINGKNYEVFVNSDLGISYTLNPNGTYTCEGRNFDSWQALENYFKFKKMSGEVKTPDENTLIKVKGNTRVKYDLSKGTIEYQFKVPGSKNDYQSFASEQDYKSYLKAYKLAGGKVDTKNKNAVSYHVDGASVTVKIMSDGTLEYEADFNGKKITAKTEAELKSAIALAAKLGKLEKELGIGTANEGSTPETQQGAGEGESFTIKGEGYTVIVKSGKVDIQVESGENSNASITPENKEKIQTTAETYLAEHPADAGTATAETSAVSVTLAEGATATLDTGGKPLTVEPIANVEGTATAVAVKSDTKTTATVELPKNITYDQEVPVKATKVKVTADLVDAKSIGEQIADSIQEGLTGKPVFPNVQAGNTGGEGNTGNTGSGGSTFEIPDFTTAVTAITTIANTISTISSEGIDAVKSAADEIKSDKVEAIGTAEGDIKSDKVEAIGTAEGKIGHSNVEDIGKAEGAIGHDNVAAIGTAEGKIGYTHVEAIKTAEENIGHKNIDDVKAAIDSISIKLDSASASASATISVTATAGAAGNIGALAKGNMALAGGTRTLVGELGPELVVSNGRYFLVGQNGAEFVDLEKDAIVFNHKQTERLLSQGGIGSRGVPFTNEDNAISYAKGNVEGPAQGGGSAHLQSLSFSGRGATRVSSNAFKWDAVDVKVGPNTAKARGSGPAMASAQAALNALKQLKAMWQSLKAATAQDLAGLGGGGGGGGGGGNNDNTFLKSLEKWYNWLQEIAKQEEKINYQEKLRAKLASDNIKNGKSYYQSQKKSLDALKAELTTTRDLMTSQQVYFDQRRAQLNKEKNNPFYSLYTFDEAGQLKYNEDVKKDRAFYKNGKKTVKTDMTGFEFLSELSGRNSAGAAKYSVKDQYQALVAAGFKDYMLYDNNGKIIEYNKDKNGKKTTPKDDAAYEAAVQAFWDKIESDKEEMQSLHDSINEYSANALEIQQAQNELLQEMQDNQMELENDILDAVVNGLEKEIKEQEELKDAYSQASQDMIKGLNDSLSKEREKYAKNEEDAELLQLRRRLALLQRSGGSSSEIAALQKQINDQSKEAYFSEQERQINAIQEAADKQIERLDAQIDIATKSLEYQKENGLLWTEVARIMKESPEYIVDYLTKNTADYLSKSALTKSETADDWLFKASQWAEFRKDLANNDDTIISLLKQGTTPSDQDIADFNEAVEKTYGTTAWKALTKEQKSSLEKSFKQAYAETGDFKQATEQAISKNQTAINRASNYQTKISQQKTKFGKNWNKDIQKKATEAYLTGGSTKMEEVLAKEKLWTTKKNKDGTYSVVASTDPNNAVTKASAQKSADRTNDLNSFLRTYSKLTSKLTAKQLKTLKDKFKAAYNTAYSGGQSEANTAAIKAAKAYKPFKTLLNQKKWAAYQPNANSRWSIRELKSSELNSKLGKKNKTPSKHKIGTFDDVRKSVSYNNKLYNQWVKEYQKNKNTAQPKYDLTYKYDQGGMVESTGAALLHAKESVLTSQQTDILRNEILGRNKNSLMNLLLDFKNAYSNIGNTGITTQPSIIIENASVNMNVGSIANDYDARRAGEQALSEMLKIARKKGAASALRR